jgi:hypothetical protein
MEYVSLVTGYQALLIVVALLYGAAFLTGPLMAVRRAQRAAVEQPA